MGKRILILQGHPDPAEGHFGHALADAYAAAARAAGHDVQHVTVATLDFPLLRGFLEQVLRPGFALTPASGGLPKKLLGGRSARVIVTMGMPALVYRWLFRAHSVKAPERNILGFVGFAPVHETLVGLADGDHDAARTRALARVTALGSRAD